MKSQLVFNYNDMVAMFEETDTGIDGFNTIPKNSPPKIHH